MGNGRCASRRSAALRAEPVALSQAKPAAAIAKEAEEDDCYWDYDDNDCANCGGEGFTYGCSWDWQCDTYDEGEGTCLCTRRCDWCNPVKPDPALQAVLTDALAAATGTAKTLQAAECEASQSGGSASERNAQGPVA